MAQRIASAVMARPIPRSIAEPDFHEQAKIYK